jgi:hypothetical protein
MNVMKIDMTFLLARFIRKFSENKNIIKETLEQAWAILRYLVAMIYLNIKKLLPEAEVLYSRTIYSLEINSRTKRFLVPTCDLQTGPIVLEEDLGIP